MKRRQLGGASHGGGGGAFPVRGLQGKPALPVLDKTDRELASQGGAGRAWHGLRHEKALDSSEHGRDATGLCSKLPGRGFLDPQLQGTLRGVGGSVPIPTSPDGTPGGHSSRGVKAAVYCSGGRKLELIPVWDPICQDSFR